MHALDNPIRPYAWGSTTDIPSMLGVPPTGEPQAELWMGAHPASPSSIEGRSLIDVIESDPQGELGSSVLSRFGVRLPFLLKLLAAAAPLSLQAHPNPLQAKEGFERENSLGIPLDAPHRNYKDPYSKPEMICALTPLEALVGFRPEEEVRSDLESLGLQELLGDYFDGTAKSNLAESGGASAESAKGALSELLSLDEAARKALVDAVVSEIADSELPIADLLRRLASRYPSDTGVIVALLMNHIVLSPGQAVLLPAGNLHAYIQGFGVELLANSDNVLRGGLTPKHIDIPELTALLDFTPGLPKIASSTDGPGEFVFPSPAPEFRLSRVVVEPGAPVALTPRGPQILLCTQGSVSVSSGAGSSDSGPVDLTPGRSAFASARDGDVTVTGTGVLFRATVGD